MEILKVVIKIAWRSLWFIVGCIGWYFTIGIGCYYQKVKFENSKESKVCNWIWTTPIIQAWERENRRDTFQAMLSRAKLGFKWFFALYSKPKQ